MAIPMGKPNRDLWLLNTEKGVLLLPCFSNMKHIYEVDQKILEVIRTKQIEQAIRLTINVVLESLRQRTASSKSTWVMCSETLSQNNETNSKECIVPFKTFCYFFSNVCFAKGGLFF